MRLPAIVILAATLALAEPAFGQSPDLSVTRTESALRVEVRLAEPTTSVVIERMDIAGRRWNPVPLKMKPRDKDARVFVFLCPPDIARSVRAGEVVSLIVRASNGKAVGPVTVVVSGSPPTTSSVEPVSATVSSATTPTPTPTPTVPVSDPPSPPAEATAQEVPGTGVVSPNEPALAPVPAGSALPTRSSTPTRTPPAVVNPTAGPDTSHADVPVAPITVLRPPPTATPLPVPATPLSGKSRRSGLSPRDILALVVAVLCAGLGGLLLWSRRRSTQRPGESPDLAAAGAEARRAREVLHVADGDLEVVGSIARGGFCDIVKVTLRGRPAPLALKVLRKEFQDSSRMAEALEREGSILAALNGKHPQEIFIRLCGRGGIADGEVRHPYLLLEFVDGLDLRALVRAKGPLEEKDCLETALEVARALSAMHGDGFVHGDVSPENVVRLPRRDRSTGTRHRLIDFGDARRMDDTERVKEITGKPDFLSPEQTRGFAATPQSDVYGLGMVLYFLRAGRAAFSSGNSLDTLKRHTVSEIVFPASFGPFLSGLVGCMCQKLPSARPASGDVVKSIEAHLRVGAGNGRDR